MLIEGAEDRITVQLTALMRVLQLPHGERLRIMGEISKIIHHIDPPRVITKTSAWKMHLPFAMVITAMLRPSTFVELGTHTGDSYFAFCQKVKSMGLNTKCYAVDTWAGDEHAGIYGEDIFATVKKISDDSYGGFSTLLRKTFQEALEGFEDGSIDLLHIDGLHTYEAVKNDFESWLPKLSDMGVVIFHDINVRGRGFGVWKLWEELKAGYPSFEVAHGHGLGILRVGPSIPEEAKWLFTLDGAEGKEVEDFFNVMGSWATYRDPEGVYPAAKSYDYRQESELPVVSIVVPLYDHQEYVEFCLWSIVNQNYPALDLIVIDDGSRDGSRKKVESFLEGSKVKFTFLSKENEGLVKTLNRGLALSKGVYFAELASDDILLPGSIYKRVKALEEDSALSSVFADVLPLKGSVPSNKRQFEGKKRPFISSSGRISNLVIGRDIIIFPTGLIRKSFLDKVGGFDEGFKFYEDIYMEYELALDGRVGYIDEPVMYYRSHGTNVSKTYTLATRRERVLALEKLYEDGGLDLEAGLKKSVNDTLYRQYWNYFKALRKEGKDRDLQKSILMKGLKLRPFRIKNLRYRYYMFFG